MGELNGGQLAARQLKLAGIDTAFGVVAGPMIEVMAGMQAEGIRVVNCRHEESAAFMASACRNHQCCDRHARRHRERDAARRAWRLRRGPYARTGRLPGG
ncbi:hypothetical protein J0H33_07225 [bacterium]|nr:hypothetical protein [bacterium]